MDAKGDAEWVVYRLKDGVLRAVPRRRWNGWTPSTLKEMGVVLVSKGLTEEQANQFVALTEET